MFAHSDSDWNSVSQEQINADHQEEQKGITLRFTLSPTDMPIAWRERQVTTNNGKRIVIIEFKYLSETEPRKPETRGRCIHFDIGKNSRRIYQITIDADRILSEHNSSDLQIELVTEAIRTSIDSEPTLNRGNSEAIMKIISISGEDRKRAV
ncbi:hypothetical protein HKW98_09075 [Stutzerimonas urumqiensis]|uniref:hypothetical protein n=1 Tax=Stutzerimonas urumqiensis TaxID=638269 RepID=UPI003BAAC61C